MTREAQRRIEMSALLLFVAFVFASSTHAQNPQPSPTPLMAPPPFKMIVKEERMQIEQTGKDSSRRLKLTIEFATAHLGVAEQHTAQGNFEAAQTEVGMYHALIENVRTFMSTLKRDSNKTRDLYKKLELALRAHGPRLTAMRRITPLEFAVWIKQVEDYAREGRTEALNSFYGHTVVRDKTDKNEPPKETPTPTPKSNQP
jgi:hypothetical protein